MSSSNKPTNQLADTMQSIVDALHANESDSTIIDLIKLGCDVKVLDELGMLHVAIVRPTIDVAHEILKLGVHVDAHNKSGYTALSCSIHAGALEPTAMLLYYGANIHMLRNVHEILNSIPIVNLFMGATNILFDYFHKDEIFSWYATKVCLYKTQHDVDASIRIPRLMESGTNFSVDCAQYKGNPLLIAARVGDLKLFKSIWSKIDMQHIASIDWPFLHYYLRECKFSPSEWLEGLYLLLQPPGATHFFKLYCRPHFTTYLFDTLLNQCLLRKIGHDEKMGLIYTFLYFGVSVSVQTIERLYIDHGFNEELKAILHCGRFDVGGSDLVMTRFILVHDPTTDDINRYFPATRQRRAVDDYRYSNYPEVLNQKIEVITKTLRYFWIPKFVHYGWLSPRSLEDCKALHDKVAELPKVRSLIDLSRMRVRTHIIQYYKLKKAYQFYDAVKRLPLPQLIKDIICMKEPIYP